MEFKLKNDRYRSARGGEAHLLDISCTRCTNQVLKYQKDGKGDLLRLYLNRIFHPPDFERLQYFFTRANYRQMPALKCPSCSGLIGTPTLYSDGRPAFKLIRGTYHKRKVF